MTDAGIVGHVFTSPIAAHLFYCGFTVKVYARLLVEVFNVLHGFVKCLVARVRPYRIHKGGPCLLVTALGLDAVGQFVPSHETLHILVVLHIVRYKVERLVVGTSHTSGIAWCIGVDLFQFLLCHHLYLLAYLAAKGMQTAA